MLIHLMLLRGEPQPPGTEIYKMSTYLLDSLKASKQQALVAGLAVYPDKPADIGSVPWLILVILSVFFVWND